MVLKLVAFKKLWSQKIFKYHTAWMTRSVTRPEVTDTHTRGRSLHSAPSDISDVRGNVPWIRGDRISVGAMTTFLSKRHVLEIICVSFRPLKSIHTGHKSRTVLLGSQAQLLPGTIQEGGHDRSNQSGQPALRKTRT